MGSQPQCSMHHQESSCLDVLTLGSQISSTLVTWSLPPTHIPPSMPSPIGASDSASDLVLVPCQRRLTSTWALFSRPHSRGPSTSSIRSAEATASSHSACPDAALSLCQSTWHPRSSAFLFAPVSHGALSFSLGPRPLCASWTRTPGQARSLPAFSALRVSPWERGHHALDMCSRLELRCRVQGLISRLSTTRLPDGDVFSVNCGPDRLVYGRGSSPEQVRLCGLARHAGLPEVADSVISPCSGPSGAESHRRLWRHGASIPGSLTMGQATQLSWLRACTHPICW